MEDNKLFGYQPEEPNGVLIILKEEGGKNNENKTEEEHRIGNGDWYRNYICTGINEGKSGIYRERFKDLLSVAGIGSSNDDLKRCFYICMSYASGGTSASEVYKKMDKKTRFRDIKSAFLRQVSGKVSHAYIFVIKDTFDRLLDDEEINKICKPGIKFKADEPEKYKMYTKTEEGVCYTVYSVHHPIGALKKDKWVED